MYHLIQNSFDFYKAGPLFKKNDWADVPCEVVAKQVHKYYSGGNGNAKAEAEAVKFYLLNHLFSDLSHKFHAKEGLAAYQKVADAYTDTSADIGTRLFNYMLLIITRESRHLHAGNDIYPTLATKFGKAYVDFHKKVSHKESLVVADMFMSDPPKMALGPYCAAVTYQFKHGSYGHGYGGEPWSQIAETVRKLVYAEITMEMFIDTAFTLAHNNGSMFDKGMMYHGCDKGEVLRILDVQRSGQIPQFVHQILGNTLPSGNYKSDVQATWDMVKGLFLEFHKPVSWIKVKELGAIGSYSSLIKAEKDSIGYSVAGKPAIKTGQKLGIMKDMEVTVIQRKGKV